MYAVVYIDDGPDGPCGQDCSTTSPHTMVYVFDDEDSMMVFRKSMRLSGRRNPQVRICFPVGESNTDTILKVE